MSDQDFIILDEEDTKEKESGRETPAENGRNEMDTRGQERDKNRDDGYEKICFICHRPESVTGKMIDLPNHITVCPDCMQRSFDAMTSGSIDLSRLMNMPGVQFLNMADLENMQPRAQKIKKKKEKPKEFHQLNIKDIEGDVCCGIQPL